MIRNVSLLAVSFVVVLVAGCVLSPRETMVTPPPSSGGAIVIRVASAENSDPFKAGAAAAKALKSQMGKTRAHTIIMSECFEDAGPKSKVLKGVSSVFPRDTIFGASSYGSFAQAGCLPSDSVTLMAIGGDGISVAAVLERKMGILGLTMAKDKEEIAKRLRDAGARQAKKLPRTPNDRLLIMLPDAHSPKNQFLVEGVQTVLGKKFPITGGSANKNAGQTFVYFAGRMYTDSAVALMLSGDFQVALAGRQAKDNDAVIATAKQGAAAAMAAFKGKPAAVLAFNCAGRRGKLKNMDDELAAMQAVLGKELPLFGCYCAGEIGPLDTSEKTPGVLCGGSGWHVMFTVIGR